MKVLLLAGGWSPEREVSLKGGEQIAAALKGTGVKVLVDGGIRTGVDVCKALALGADGVLLARPYVTAVYGGGAEGVRLLTQKLKGELEDTMAMCGVHSLSEISRELLF